MNQEKIPLARFYRQIFSRYWPERLKAYDTIADELSKRGCRLFSLPKLTPYQTDVKLLAGQIVSIYMKHQQPLDFETVVCKLDELYDLLLEPLREEKSKGHRVIKQLLLGIYDDDDVVARRQIDRFFHAHLRQDLSVFENICRCYGATMREVRERYKEILQQDDDGAHSAAALV